MHRQDYWVWLNSIPNIGPRKGKQLLDHFRDPENIWNAAEAEFKCLHFLDRDDSNQILNSDIRAKTKELICSINKAGIKVITLVDDLYPEYLKNIYDPPLLLYLKGNLVKNEKAVAVVGSRRATAYGQKMAGVLAQELAMNGITVVSGMARGIDSYAHKSALDANGRTIAVTGCGLDIVYPPENRRLAEIIAAKGAVISEYMPGIQPMPHNFPARNRIISGISLGVVVIEASEKSGSLITVNMALEQGRDVFAVPGNVTSMNSRGTNKLIKDGAKLVTGIDDILEELSIFDLSFNSPKQSAPVSNEPNLSQPNFSSPVSSNTNSNAPSPDGQNPNTSDPSGSIHDSPASNGQNSISQSSGGPNSNDPKRSSLNQGSPSSDGPSPGNTNSNVPNFSGANSNASSPGSPTSSDPVSNGPKSNCLVSGSSSARSIKYGINSLYALLKGLDREERLVVRYVLEGGEIHIDELLNKCCLSAQIMNSVLVMLELKGIVEQMPGKIFKIKD